MENLLALAGTVAADVWATVVHNWPYLLLSTLIASWVQVYVDQNRLGPWLRRRTWVAILAAVAIGALTPFCSCGTTAVVLGALASSVPWAPVVAFMASSPLTSPSEFVLSVGLFGRAFAVTYFVAAIAVGLLGGAAAWWLEAHGFLAGQARMAAARSTIPDAGAPPAAATGGAGVRTLLAVVEPQVTTTLTPSRSRQFTAALWVNTRRLTLYFLAFATIGYLIIRLIPVGVMTDWLGQGNPIWSVPLAALLGVPVYLNTDASLPLVVGLIDGGMSPGAAIAFLITGAGTSVGSIAGMLVITRWRIVALILATLFLTAITTGWLAALWL